MLPFVTEINPELANVTPLDAEPFPPPTPLIKRSPLLDPITPKSSEMPSLPDPTVFPPIPTNEMFPDVVSIVPSNTMPSASPLSLLSLRPCPRIEMLPAPAIKLPKTETPSGSNVVPRAGVDADRRRHLS